MRLATIICAHAEEPSLNAKAKNIAGRIGPVITIEGEIGIRWESQAEMRQYGIELARLAKADWLFQSSVDEILIGDPRPSLEGWREPVFPAPYIEEDGRRRLMGHKFLNLHRVRRIVAWGSFVELDNGEVWEYGAIEEPSYLNLMFQLPWRIEHHPEWRPDHKTRERLGAREHLEPIPASYRVWRLPVLSSPETLTRGGIVSDTMTHYCPACGARYPEAGVCTNQHPAEPTEALPEPETVDANTESAPVDPANGTEEVVPYEGPVADPTSQVPDLMREVATLQRERDEQKARADKLENDLVAVSADRDEWKNRAESAMALNQPEPAPAEPAPVEGDGGGATVEEPAPAADTTTPEAGGGASDTPSPSPWPDGAPQA